MTSLAQTTTCAELSAACGLAGETVSAALTLLLNAGLIGSLNERCVLDEDDDPSLRQWEFHDLLFHARTRLGGYDHPIGGTFRFRDALPPLPVLKPRVASETVRLYRPDVSRMHDGPPFSSVLEGRKSIREYGSAPLTIRQLGEFLYRAARVREVRAVDPLPAVHYEVSNRPYPSGGAAYDLEIYVVANACAGLASGLYHYDPMEHVLDKVAAEDRDLRSILADASRAAGLKREPQVLLTISSRFHRVSWKYSAIAYALTLKNVGVLFQTMYLVATAMGLAPCALGTGNSRTFAKAAQTDPLAESSVGEFLLGSSPDERP